MRFQLTVFLVVTFFLNPTVAQHPGTQTDEEHLLLPMRVNIGGMIEILDTKFVLGSDPRRVYSIEDGQACETQDGFDPILCPDGRTCAENCEIEAINSETYTNVFGISTPSDGSLRLNFVTESPYSTVVGGGGYLLSPGGETYQMFQLKNRELVVDVDTSNLPCGLNGALFFSEMEEDGGMASYPSNRAGAKYGVGYCDGQCKHSLKYRAGEVNVEGDDSSLGICCVELDIWEANSMSQTYTTHGCTVEGYYICEGGLECGDGDDFYNGVCDKTGCQFGAFRLNQHEFFGPSPDFEVDSSLPFSIVTQFITEDGTDEGELVEIRRFYHQNGTFIHNSRMNFDGVYPYDSITDDFCSDYKELFGEVNDFAAKGSLKGIGEALDRGMVMVFSLWEDHSNYMLWLDSIFPADSDPSTPGVWRGPCPTDGGRPDDLEANYPDAFVTFSNIVVGHINSTFGPIIG